MVAEARRNAYVAKTRAELDALAKEGVVLAGNAFSPMLLVKGELNDVERSDASALFVGADGQALRAALDALGYAPEEWCGLATVAADSASLSSATLRLAVTTLDPSTIVLCDESAAVAMREAYAVELSMLPEFDQAVLAPGRVVSLLGMRALNLGGFEASLGSMDDKQRVWAWLKQLPPLNEPY